GQERMIPFASRTETWAPPRSAGTTLSGCPSIATAVASTPSAPTAPSSSASARSAPARAAAALEPRPRFSGIELWMDSSAASERGSFPAEEAARNAASITRLVESGGSRSAPSPESLTMRRPSPPGVTRTIRSGPESAMPIASNPAPRFEVEQGTRTVNGFIAPPPSAAPPGARSSRGSSFRSLHPDPRLHRARGREPRQLLLGRRQRRLGRLVGEQHHFGVPVAPGLALDDARQPDAVLGQDARDLGEHAGLIVDGEPEVAARPHLRHGQQPRQRPVLARRR